MQAVGRVLREADIQAVYVVHGSFVGGDGSGLFRELSRFWPAAGGPLRKLQKQLLDAIAKDTGNYTPEFAEAFADGTAVPNERPIPVRVFNWSSENNHIGRADAAIRLIGQLLDDEQVANGRTLVWSHSHGGNVLALITNLLGGDEDSRQQFFEACRSYYSIRRWNTVDLPEWPRVASLLETEAASSLGERLDLATFGTPVRYGWETTGYGKLLHFIHHRPVPGKNPLVAEFPTDTDDVMHAKYGDYIQQIGIAGTNFVPPLWAIRAGQADRRLGRLLQPGLRRRDLLERLKLGVRTHDEGTNLLVDYGTAQGHIWQHVVGHAVYTRLDWLLFHAEEVARRFYGLADDN